MILRFIADDFTGASDVLLQCRKGGRDAAIVTDIAADAKPQSFDGAATTTRSMNTAELTAFLPGLLDECRDADVLLYKVCSTFDSSPTIGSIGQTVQVIREHDGSEGPVVVVPAQPSFGRFTVFGNHFAASGNETFRLDRHPVMSTHPSTPMAEADLRKLLEEQGVDHTHIAHIPVTELRSNPYALTNLLSGEESNDVIVVDAIEETDLDRVARQVLSVAKDRRGYLPVIGSGGIAGALARATSGGDEITSQTLTSGPTLVLSGSRSPVTKAQIEMARAAGWTHIELDGYSLVEKHETPNLKAVAEILRSEGNVIVSLSESEGKQLDPAALAKASGLHFSLLIRAVLESDPSTRIAVLGGDTSSWTISNLQPRRIRVAAEFVQAGPILTIDAPDIPPHTPFLLKGGQVGEPDTLITFAQF